MEAGDSGDLSKYKVRVHAMATVYQKRALPKMENQVMESGLTVQAQNWYDEFDCQQLAVNYNALYISEHHLDKLLDELKAAIKQSMRDKGLVTP